MYDSNIEEQQISEVTGHKSVAICNYKCTSMAKQRSTLDILYGKKLKSVLSATITSTETASFDLGLNSQAAHTHRQDVKPSASGMEIKPTVNVNVRAVKVDTPILNIE